MFEIGDIISLRSDRKWSDYESVYSITDIKYDSRYNRVYYIYDINNKSKHRVIDSLVDLNFELNKIHYRKLKLEKICSKLEI